MILTIPETLGMHHLKGLDGSLYYILSRNRCHKLVSTFFRLTYLCVTDISVIPADVISISGTLSVVLAF